MDLKGIREMSAALFGRDYRLELAAAIHQASGEPVTTQQLSDDTGIRYPRVQEDLKRLAACGMLVQQPRRGPEVEYKATAGPYWQTCAEILLELRGS